MEAFKQKNRVFSLEEQRTLLLKQRTELDTSLKNTEPGRRTAEKTLFPEKPEEGPDAKDKSLYTNTERDKIIVDASPDSSPSSSRNRIC